MQYVGNTPYAGFEGDSKVLTLLSDGPLREQLLFTTAFLVMQYCAMYMMGVFTNTVMVVVGMARMEECAPWLGSLSAAYTVRNAWS